MNSKRLIWRNFLRTISVGISLSMLTGSAFIATAQATEVITWFDSGAAWKETVKQWDEAFAKEHPGIKVKWVTQDPLEISTKLLMAFSINEGPDVCLSNTVRPLDVELEMEAWTNLASLIKSDPELKEIVDHLRPGSVETFVRGDRIWGLPHSVLMVDLFVRKSWLEKVGWEKPWPYIEDWNELFELAKKFTFGDPDGDGSDNTFGWGQYGKAGSSATYAWRRFMMASDGHPAENLITEDGSPLWNCEEGIRAARQIQEMFKAGVMPPDLPLWTHKEFYAAVGGGVLGMGRFGPWNVKPFDEGMDDDYDISPFPPPVKGMESYGMQWCNSVHMNASTRVGEAAYTWLKFLMSKTGQEILFQTVGQVARTDLNWDELIDNPRLMWFFNPQTLHPAAAPEYKVTPMSTHPMFATAGRILGERINKLLVDFSADPVAELAAAEVEYKKEWERWKADKGK